MTRMGVSGWVFLLVPAYLGSPGPTAVKRLCVCVCVCVCVLLFTSTVEPFCGLWLTSCYVCIHTYMHTHTHTHTRLTAPCPGLPGSAATRKVKPIWIFLKQEIVTGSGISWTICKSAPRSRQITTPAPQHSFFIGRMPFLPPNQQRQSTEGTTYMHTYKQICRAPKITERIWGTGAGLEETGF